MSESTWDDYVSADSSTTDSAAPDTTAVEEPVLAPDAASALDSATSADSWADWNAETAQTWTDSAQGELDYAQQQYATGWTDAGDAALARADYALDTAESHTETATDYAQTADSWAEEAVADQATADHGASSYDTSSYDTTSYDTTSTDTTSYDAGTDDSGTAEV